MTKKIFICAVLLFFTLVPNVQAQVVINEFSSSTSDDWIELFSSEDINIGEWLIKDSSSQIGDKIPINTFIGPSTSKYYVFDAGNRLNGDGDEIKLYGKDGLTLINSVTYNDSGDICLPSQSGSIGRYPEDGNPTIDRFSNHTKNGSNSGAILDACPTPTPTNTPTPTPTNKPDPTNTPFPTSTPVPTNTPTPTTKLTPTSTPTPIEKKDDGEVLGQAESIESSREKLIDEDVIASPDLEASDKKFPIVAVLFVIGGLMFIIGAGYLYFKSQKIENGESKTTEEDENSS